MPTPISTTTCRRYFSGAFLLTACLLLSACSDKPVQAEPSSQAKQPADPAPAWQPVAKLPRGLIGHAATATDNRILVTGGIYAKRSLTNPGAGASKDVLAYDPKADRWDRLAQLPEGRFDHAQTRLPDGRILIVGGRTLSANAKRTGLKSCLYLDPETGQTQPAPELPRAAARPTLHTLTTADGEPRIVAIIGRLAAVLKDDTWDTIRLRHPRNSHAAVPLPNGQLLVIGGTNRDSLELIDTESMTSTRLSVRLPQQLDDHAAVPLSPNRPHHIAVLGGQHSAGGETTDTSSILHAPDGDWTQATLTPGPSLNVPLGIADHLVVPFTTPAGTAYLLIGGESEHRGKDTELDLTRILHSHGQRITPGPQLPRPYDDAAAVVFQEHAYVLGGQVSGTFLGRPVPIPVAFAHRIPLSTLNATDALGDPAQPPPAR
ncbi:MAG: kelch repeat-containing protein [Planctomycetota bacterium]